MSIIQAEIYDAFIEAGASEPKARAAAVAVAKSDEVATRLDLAELKTYLTQRNNVSTGLILTAIFIATTVIIAFIN